MGSEALAGVTSVPRDGTPTWLLRGLGLPGRGEGICGRFTPQPGAGGAGRAVPMSGDRRDGGPGRGVVGEEPGVQRTARG